MIDEALREEERECHSRESGIVGGGGEEEEGVVNTEAEASPASLAVVVEVEEEGGEEIDAIWSSYRAVLSPKRDTSQPMSTLL